MYLARGLQRAHEIYVRFRKNRSPKSGCTSISISARSQDTANGMILNFLHSEQVGTLTVTSNACSLALVGVKRENTRNIAIARPNMRPKHPNNNETAMEIGTAITLSTISGSKSRSEFDDERWLWSRPIMLAKEFVGILQR